MKKVLLENDEVTIRFEDGVIYAKWKSPFIDLNVAQQAVKYRLESVNYLPYPLLSDITSVENSTKEARDFLASEKGCEGIEVLAVLINSPLSSMIGNFFLRVNKPLVPTKIFTDEEGAKKWLKQYVNR